MTTRLTRTQLIKSGLGSMLEVPLKKKKKKLYPPGTILVPKQDSDALKEFGESLKQDTVQTYMTFEQWWLKNFGPRKWPGTPKETEDWYREHIRILKSKRKNLSIPERPPDTGGFPQRQHTVEPTVTRRRDYISEAKRRHEVQRIRRQLVGGKPDTESLRRAMEAERADARRRGGIVDLFPTPATSPEDIVSAISEITGDPLGKQPYEPRRPFDTVDRTGRPKGEPPKRTRDELPTYYPECEKIENLLGISLCGGGGLNISTRRSGRDTLRWLGE